MSRASVLAICLAAAPLIISGCGPSEPGPVTNSTNAPASRVVEPKLDTRSSLHLERLGRRLKVGDDTSLIAEVFPSPAGAFAFSEPPTRLADTFEARGWESRNEGFGALLYGGKVALAMRQFASSDGARFNELYETLKNTNKGITPREESGKNVSFWFWEEGDHVLMLMRRGLKTDRYEIVEALGERSLMAELEMAPGKAKAILDRLNSLPGPTAEVPTAKKAP